MKRIFKFLPVLLVLVIFFTAPVVPKLVAPAFATIADNYEPVKLLGNGTTTEFSFGWALISEDNIRVYLENITTGVQTLQTLNTDYTVDFDDDTPGGTVTFTTAPTSSYYVVIGREIEKTQETSFTTSAGFQAKVIEGRLDKLTGQTQDLNEILKRAIKTKIGGTAEIEIAEPEAGKALKWNDDADGIENSEEDLDDIVTDSQAAQTAAESARDTATTQAATATAQATLATTAKSDAVTAKTAAQTAQAAAETAQSASEAARDLALTYKTASENAKTGAESAQTSAESAQSSAEDAQEAAEIAQGSAESARDTAVASASTATTKAGEASTSASNAATSEANAAIYAVGLKATSTSSIAIATGSKTFTIQSGKQFSAGQFVLISSDADPENYMHGQVTSYSGTSLVVNVIDVGGSGTLADWTISVSGSRGATGATGATGSISIATGAGTVDAITADFSPDVSLADKTFVAVVALGANTSTTPTFAPDSLTAHTITKQGGSALLAGDIPASGFVMLLEYNLANTRWELLNPSSKAYADTKVSGYGTVNPTNLLSGNSGNFESWPNGVSSAPDGWTLDYGSVARESSNIAMGTYSASGAHTTLDFNLRQEIHAVKGISYWQGKTVTFRCWVKSAVDGSATIQILDGVGISGATYTGGGVGTWLTVTRTIDSSATKVEILLANGSATAAYFDGAMCVEGSSAFAYADKPLPAVSTSKATLGIDSGTVSLSGAGEATINFNFTFASAPVVVITGLYNATGQNYGFYIKSISTTQAVVRTENAGSWVVQWVAIGTKA